MCVCESDSMYQLLKFIHNEYIDQEVAPEMFKPFQVNFTVLHISIQIEWLDCVAVVTP